MWHSLSLSIYIYGVMYIHGQVWKCYMQYSMVIRYCCSFNTMVSPKEIKQQPYKTDLRARSTTLRVAAGIEPAHMRFALQRANETGAKWKQMFRTLGWIFWWKWWVDFETNWCYRVDGIWDQKNVNQLQQKRTEYRYSGFRTVKCALTSILYKNNQKSSIAVPYTAAIWNHGKRFALGLASTTLWMKPFLWAAIPASSANFIWRTRLGFHPQT